MEYHMSRLDPNALFEVESAYMGMAIYKMSATKGCAYGSRDSNGNQDCEHVTFHKEMMEKNKAKIRILPQNICEISTDLNMTWEQNSPEYLKYTIQRRPMIPKECIVLGDATRECNRHNW